MPYPAQIHYDALIETARQIIEQEGLDRLSLSRLAAALGVKAPSLYKHVKNKAAIIAAVNQRTYHNLTNDVLSQTDVIEQPYDRIVTIAQTYRRYALEHPVLYELAFTSEDRGDEDVMVSLALPLQALVAQISGENHALEALRGLWALIHGYVMLEINQQMRRGGNLDETFELVVKTYLQGWRISHP